MPVHPHACGELAWRHVNGIRVDRFIPTHVGNSLLATVVHTMSTVHPHACGELFFLMCSHSCLRFIPTHVGNSAADLVFHILHGSSPRMWGTLEAQK